VRIASISCGLLISISLLRLPSFTRFFLEKGADRSSYNFYSYLDLATQTALGAACFSSCWDRREPQRGIGHSELGISSRSRRLDRLATVAAGLGRVFVEVAVVDVCRVVVRVSMFSPRRDWVVLLRQEGRPELNLDGALCVCSCEIRKGYWNKRHILATMAACFDAPANPKGRTLSPFGSM
jgi:hypothetical protein